MIFTDGHTVTLKERVPMCLRESPQEPGNIACGSRAVRAQIESMNRAIMEARSHITWYMMGVGLWMPGWWFFFRPDQHVDDLVNVDAALKALRSRDPKSAAGHLQKVWMMGWGHRVGTEAFNLLWQRFHADPSWGGAWDQQQECVNVHADYVALARGAGLAIRAVDGLTGLPMRGVTALAFAAGGTLAFSGMVSLDSEGDGEITSLAPGSYSLYLFSDGYAPRSLPALAVPSPKLNVALTPGGRVEVRSEAAVTGRLVEASGAAYLVGPWRRDGGITVTPPVSVWEHVAPGSYQLIVSEPSGDRSYPVHVAEGRTTTVEVR